MALTATRRRRRVAGPGRSTPTRTCHVDKGGAATWTKGELPRGQGSSCHVDKGGAATWTKGELPLGQGVSCHVDGGLMIGIVPGWGFYFIRLTYM